MAALPNKNFEFHPYATCSKEKRVTDSEQEHKEMVKTSTKGLLSVHVELEDDCCNGTEMN